MTVTQDLRLPEITDAAGLRQAIDGADRPALILFDADWCSPARRIEARLLRLFRGQCIDLLRLNVDRLPDLAKKFAISAVPTLALFRFGQIAATRLGDVEDGDLTQWLERECSEPCT
jgi:thioredoxin-like negative regulator of GroEL